MKVLALGPFFGDFESELTTFRPFCKWLQKVVEYDNVYISTHSNRLFLYNDISNIYNVYENLTRNELGQNGYIHKSFTIKDFMCFLKKFENHIISETLCNKKDIQIHYLNYLKSKPPCSIYNKIFEPVSFPHMDIDIDENYTVFIPDKKCNFKDIKRIYKFLQKEECNFYIIGDMKTYYPEQNIVLKYIDYPENGYKYIFNYLYHASSIICPLGFWTYLCNLQGLPVFSWGEGVASFKEGGIYHFENYKSMVITSNMKGILNSLKYFLDINRGRVKL